MNVYLAIFLTVVAYLLGSIPTGYLIVLWKKGVDIRTIESGVTGGNNVSRVCGRRWGLVTIIGDFLKGFAPASAAVFIMGLHWSTGLVGLLAVIGHVFPIFIPKPRFKGGKGVATCTGVLVPILILYVNTFPRLWVICLIVAIIVAWAIILVFLKTMGLASIFLMGAMILFFGLTGLLLYPSYLLIFISLMAALVLWSHRGNARRLWREGKDRLIESSWEKT